MGSSVVPVVIVVIVGLTAVLEAQSTRPTAEQPTGPSVSPQHQRPSFRAEVELAQLDVTVLDSDRRPVSDLNEADFRLFVEGKPQPIRAFSAIRIPGPVQPTSVSAADVPQTDVATNGVARQDGRLVMILMDRTIPAGEPTLAARRIATAAVEALGPHDLAALLSTSGGVPQNLTANRDRLITAINQRDWSTGLSKEQEDVVGKQDPLSDGRCLCGLCVLETVTRVSDAVQHSPRRHKMLLFIGSSVIFQTMPRAFGADTGCERPLEDAVRRLRTSLALSHLTIHSIDPTGLSSVGPHARASSPGGKPGEDRLRKVRQMQEDTSELLQEQGSLQYLPAQTGGRLVINTNAPEEKLPEIFAESSVYYVLAFEPGRLGRSSAGAAVEVKVSRPGLQVHTQRRYRQASAGRTTSDAAANAASARSQALLRLLPVGTTPLALSAAAFAGPGTDGTVVMNVDVGAFSYGATSKLLRFSVSALDQTGREIRTATRTATVTFNADRTAEANVQTSLELPPGDYELRMAVEDGSAQIVSSVFAPIVVPRFATASFSLSDTVLQASAGAPASTSPDVVLSPTTRRTFDRREQVRAVLQLYQGTMRTEPLRPVAVRNRVFTADGRAVRDQRLTLKSENFANRTAGMAVDLSGLPPGGYVLAIDASCERETARRRVPFAVR